MNSDDFEVLALIDQSVPIKMEQSLFDRIDLVLAQSLKEKDPSIALSAGKNLLGVIRLGGLGLAKLLHGVYTRWNDYEYSGTVYELAEEELGILAKATVNRYVAVWDMLTGGYIPKDVIEYIKAKPMRQLVPMASLISQGFNVLMTDWLRMAHAIDIGEVAEIVREIKGKSPKKQTLTIFLEDDGTLQAWYNSQTKNIGYLDIKNENNEIVAKSIERIIDNSGIIRR